MATTHFSLSTTMPDGRELSGAEIREAIGRAFPGVETRVTEGAPSVLVVVTDDPEADATIGIAGRVNLMFVDARSSDGLEVARNRVRDNEPIQIANTQASYDDARARAVELLDAIIAEQDPAGPSYR